MSCLIYPFIPRFNIIILANEAITARTLMINLLEVLFKYERHPAKTYYCKEESK